MGGSKKEPYLVHSNCGKSHRVAVTLAPSEQREGNLHSCLPCRNRCDCIWQLCLCLLSCPWFAGTRRRLLPTETGGVPFPCVESNHLRTRRRG